MQNFKTILLLSFMFHQNSDASVAVNMKNGSLILHDSEIHQSKSGFKWNVQRTYRSRSLFRGVFGQGWCSVLDLKIQFISKGELQIIDCDYPRPVRFQLDAKASQYVSTLNSKDIVKIGFGFYERINQDNQKTRFNMKGQPLEIRNEKDIYTFNYNSRGLIQSIKNKKDTAVEVKWHPLLDLIEKIGATQYRYTGFQLIKVTGGSKDQVKLYNYDDLDNLTNRRENKNHLLIEYYKAEDRVFKIKSSCTQTYEYKLVNDRITSSELTQVCPDKKLLKQRFEVLHAGLPQQEGELL